MVHVVPQLVRQDGLDLVVGIVTIERIPQGDPPAYFPAPSARHLPPFVFSDIIIVYTPRTRVRARAARSVSRRTSSAVFQRLELEKDGEDQQPARGSPGRC